MTGWHQIGDRLCASRAELNLLVWRERLQIARHLPVAGRDDDQPFMLRASFELEQALYRRAIARITPQAVTGFRGIGDQTAAPEVRSEPAIGESCALHSMPRKIHSSKPNQAREAG